LLNVGIDTIAFHTANYVLDLATLAAARGIDPDKFRLGLGQNQMAVPAPDEDIVTLAANAAKKALRDVDLESIEMLLFATESGIDQSKSAGIYVHQLLGLSPYCRVLELKQACYSATGALQLALPFLRENPGRKILLIASDIARYGLKTSGESSQGCAAVAMVLSVDPRILTIENGYGVVTEDVMDFWRPAYSNEAFVEGKYSSRLYLSMLEKTWDRYFSLYSRGFCMHQQFCYHTPVPRLVEKAHKLLTKINHYPTENTDQAVALSLNYARKIGNSYTASLYLALISLLDLSTENLSGQRVGFYSYGSGSVAEYFSGIIQPNYQDVLQKEENKKLLAERINLSADEYEDFYNFKYPEDGSELILPKYLTGHYRLAAIIEHKRMYAHVRHSIENNEVSTSIPVAKIL